MLVETGEALRRGVRTDARKRKCLDQTRGLGESQWYSRSSRKVTKDRIVSVLLFHFPFANVERRRLEAFVTTCHLVLPRRTERLAGDPLASAVAILRRGRQ